MRNVNEENENGRSLKLLEEAAAAVKKPNQTELRFSKLEQDMQLLRYALGNVLKVINDLPVIKTQIEQLDYRTLGMIKAITSSMQATVLGPIQFSDFPDRVEEGARAARDEAFWELSDHDDKEKNLTVSDTEPLDDNSYVILTTECPNEPDQAIFRSKMELSNEEFKDYKELFIGKVVGDKVSMKILGKDHEATIIATRKKPDANQ